MNEIRSYASLSGSLLARKGGAKPAMRPRPLSTPQMLDDLGWDDMGEAHEPTHEHHVPSSIAALTPAPKAPAPVREDTPVHVQQRVLAEHYEPQPAQPAQPAQQAQATQPVQQPEQAETPPLSAAVVEALRAPPARRKGSARQAQPAGRKAAFTLRLDADRHLRLRLASALTGRSSQQLVTAALDSFIETLPEVGVLAQQVPTGAGRNS